MRPPCPEHTISSVHLLTEDRETETADCVQEGHGQRAEAKEGPRLPPPGLFRLSPPGPMVVRLLGTQPGEQQQNSLVTKSPCLPTGLAVSCQPLLLVFKGKPRECSIMDT